MDRMDWVMFGVLLLFLLELATTGLIILVALNEVQEQTTGTICPGPGTEYDCSCTKSCYCNFHKATYVWEGD